MQPVWVRKFLFTDCRIDQRLGTLSDTWALNITSRRWTWLSGSNTVNQPILYGTQGLADQNNGPGARTFHSMVMHPSGEFMFVFSGFGDDTINNGMSIIPDFLLI